MSWKHGLLIIPVGLFAILISLASCTSFVVYHSVPAFVGTDPDFGTTNSGPIPSVVSVEASQLASAEIPNTDLNRQYDLMRDTAANSSCGLSWTIVAAIASKESAFGTNPDMYKPHDGGILGYGQFGPNEWIRFGNGGDIYSYQAGIPAIDRYLCYLGAGNNLESALWSYSGCNPLRDPTCHRTDTYVKDALSKAYLYGFAVNTALGPSSNALIEYARTFLGVPYVWGGTTPRGVDCSGLVFLVYQKFGATLPRVAADQYRATARISQEELQPGDLVFFWATDKRPWVSHVGIYIGNGLMINAPDVGDVVRIQPVFSGFWGQHYYGAGRVGIPINNPNIAQLDNPLAKSLFGGDA